MRAVPAAHDRVDARHELRNNPYLVLVTALFAEVRLWLKISKPEPNVITLCTVFVPSLAVKLCAEPKMACSPCPRSGRKLAISLTWKTSSDGFDVIPVSHREQRGRDSALVRLADQTLSLPRPHWLKLAET